MMNIEGLGCSLFFDEILGDESNFKNYLANILLDVDVLGKGMLEVPECLKTGNSFEAYEYGWRGYRL